MLGKPRLFPSNELNKRKISCQSLCCGTMALVIALLSVLVIVEGSTTTQWQNKQVYHHSMNTSGNDTSNCSNTWFFTRQFDNRSSACECGSDLREVIM